MIEFIDVIKNYPNGVHALHDVNFYIDGGEFVFLIGESGAGKSTVIKLLTCEERPSKGTVAMDNFDISRMKRSLVPFLRRKIGLIFQDFRLIESKTVFENVAFAMEIVGAPESVIERRVPMVLTVVGLKDKADFYPYQLSGGEAQRVGIARAMVNNPRLILADEPTGNLDQGNSETIMALLDEINRAGTTVIACTHDLHAVKRMNKRVIELKNGRVISDTPPRILEDPAKNVVPVKPQMSADMQAFMEDESYQEDSLEKEMEAEGIPQVEIPKLEELERRVRRDSRMRKNKMRKDLSATSKIKMQNTAAVDIIERKNTEDVHGQ